MYCILFRILPCSSKTVAKNIITDALTSITGTACQKKRRTLTKKSAEQKKNKITNMRRNETKWPEQIEIMSIFSVTFSLNI